MLKGPCKGQVEFQIKGTLKAPTDKASTVNVYYWIAFQYIDQLILTGGGKLDGQGLAAWNVYTCNVDPNCKALPIVSSCFENPSKIGLENRVVHYHVLGSFVMNHS